MKELRLAKGIVALVDDEDFDFLNQWKWHYSGAGKRKYVRRRHILMHRLILSGAKLVDHKNGNTLDNTRNNLRDVTPSQNARNKRPCGVSKYMGVTLRKSKNGNKWRASIVIDKKRIHIGVYENELDAARAYDEGAKMYGVSEFARLNNIPDSDDFKLYKVKRREKKQA